jgi:hypothetical protein
VCRPLQTPVCNHLEPEHSFIRCSCSLRNCAWVGCTSPHDCPLPCPPANTLRQGAQYPWSERCRFGLSSCLRRCQCRRAQPPQATLFIARGCALEPINPPPLGSSRTASRPVSRMRWHLNTPLSWMATTMDKVCTGIPLSSTPTGPPLLGPAGMVHLSHELACLLTAAVCLPCKLQPGQLAST